MLVLVFLKLLIKFKFWVFFLFVRFLNKLNVFLYFESGVVFFFLFFFEMIVYEMKKDFYVEVDKVGIYLIFYILGGLNEYDF